MQSNSYWTIFQNICSVWTQLVFCDFHTRISGVLAKSKLSFGWHYISNKMKYSIFKSSSEVSYIHLRCLIFSVTSQLQPRAGGLIEPSLFWHPLLSEVRWRTGCSKMALNDSWTSGQGWANPFSVSPRTQN